MVMPHHYAKRDLAVDPNAPPPTLAGFTGVATQTETLAPDATGLAFDPSGGGVSITAPNVGPSVAFTTSSPTTTSSSAAASQTTPVTSSSHNSLSIGTVVGACVGAAVGVIGLIGLAVFVYKRYFDSLKARARARRVWPSTRNMENDVARRRSHLEPWNKLEEGDDKWEGMYQTKEDNVAPMEKLTMFKKSPSVRTAWTHKSEEPVEFDTNMFAQYHPQLAQELASADDHKMVKQKPSIVNIRSVSGDSVNASNQAIPTPPAIYSHSQGHYWESAEVLHYEPEQMSEVKAEPEEKILTEKNILERRRTSQLNPFFSATHSRGTSLRSRSNSQSKSAPSPVTPVPAPTIPTVVLPPTPKGKDREAAENPFADKNSILPHLKRPFAPSHVPSASTSSTDSQERALKSLIAALDGADVSEAEVQERLRVASMQPSVVSANSVYTEGEEDDVTQNFPLPPSVERSYGSV